MLAWQQQQHACLIPSGEVRHSDAYRRELLHELHIHLLEPVRRNEVDAHVHSGVLQQCQAMHLRDCNMCGTVKSKVLEGGWAFE